MRKLVYIILIFLSFCLSVNAQTNWQVIDIPDFSGGLNTRDGAGGIADNELQESYNCYLLARGIAKRNGYERYNGSARISTTDQGTGIAYANFTDGAQIVATAGAAITYKGTNAWTDITGDVVITADKPYLFTMINNNILGVNSTNKPIYWDGSGNADSLSGDNIPEAPTVCEEFHGRLFLAEGRTLYWSNYLGNWTTFHPDDYQNFEENITGLKVLGDVNESALIIMTSRSIHACYFDPSIGINVGGRGAFRFDTISKKHGCISQYSIQECITEDGDIILIWADSDGLKALFGNKVIKLTDKIQPDWDNLNISVLDESVGIHYKPKRWYLLICSDGSNTDHDKVIVYDLRHWAVAGYFDWDISCASVIPVSGVDKLIGSGYSGYWNTYDSGYNDIDSPVNAYFTTKSYDGNNAIFNKTFYSLGLQHRYLGEYDIDFALYYDFSGSTYRTTYTAHSSAARLGSFTLGTDRLSGTNALVIKGTRINGQGRNAHIRVSNSEVGEIFEIYKLQLVYELGTEVLYR